MASKRIPKKAVKRLGRVKTGWCGECMREISAIQPGGLEPQHNDGTIICPVKPDTRRQNGNAGFL